MKTGLWMIKIYPEIVLITSSTIEVKIDIDVKYDLVKLMMRESEKDIEIDRLGNLSQRGINGVLLKKRKNLWEISANFIQIIYLFYKDFYFIFSDGDQTVAQTSSFKLEPNGRKNLYGIVNKLIFDFEKLWNVSGTQCYLFMKNPLAAKCPYCWDEDLQQSISTTCPHCDGGITNKYIPIGFKARKMNTRTSQFVNNKGVKVNSSILYTTFDRNNFLLEDLFFDTTTREFLEIKNASTASIGGVRTSTSLTSEVVDINDDRVKILIPLIP